MDRNLIKNMLAKQFDGKMGAFLKKRADYSADLEKDLSQLRITYGDEIVNALIPENGIVAAVSFNQQTEPKQPVQLASDHPVSTTKKRRRRRRVKSDGNEISMTDLKPIVLKAVEVMRDKEYFNRNDITAEIGRVNVSFKPNHVSLILSTLVKGITVVGKEERNGKGGQPLNRYKVTGKLGWKNPTRKRRKK